MKTRWGFVASLAGASFLLGIANAGAAPYAAYIDGTTALYFDYFALADVPGNVGRPFSAKVVFDVAKGTLSTSSDPDFSYSQSFSLRGCERIVNGVCTSDLGAQAPIVTGYLVNAAFAPVGGYRPIPPSDYVFDLTNRVNQRLAGVNPTLDIYVIESNQGQCIVTGDINNAYTEECRTRVLYMYLSTNVHSMFSSLAALMDLNSTPNLADVPPDYIGFSYRTIEQINDCTKQAAQDPVCVTRSYSPGSALWLGVVSSVVVLNDGPTTPDACKDGGWKAFGFKNQGQCVNYVNHQ